MSSQRNVLFIIIDQLRADCIAGALADHIELPHLRALADDGMRFDAHYSVTAPCGPARASLLTGLYAKNHRAVRNGTPLSRELTNVALEVRKGGYHPLLFGYTDTSPDPRGVSASDPSLRNYEGVMSGFEEIVEMRYEQSFPWRADLKAKGYDLPAYGAFYEPVAVPGQKSKLTDPAFYSAKDSDTAFLTNRTLEALSVRTDRSWFAHVTYIRPHPPFVAPAPYNHMYDPADMPMPVRGADCASDMAVHPFALARHEATFDKPITQGHDGILERNDDVTAQTLRALYFGLASEVDHHIGRLIAFLKDTGQYDTTMIVIGSDHGEMLGDHHSWGKQTFYEQASKVPLIIRDPDHREQFGGQVSHFTESVDVMPTLLEWIGLPVPQSMDGRSLMPFLRGEEAPANWRDFTYFELEFGEPGQPTKTQLALDLPLHAANLATLRDKQFKLVHFNGGLPPLLFDLVADPDEMVNLAEDPAYALTLLAMTRKLLDHRMTKVNRSLSDMAITPGGLVAHHA